jgi:hypothetical protein
VYLPVTLPYKVSASDEIDITSVYNEAVFFNAILEAGLRVHGDIAVIACGNLYFDKSLRVPLLSVDQQSRAIGEHAGEPGSVAARSQDPAAAEERAGQLHVRGHGRVPSNNVRVRSERCGMSTVASCWWLLTGIR